MIKSNGREHVERMYNAFNYMQEYDRLSTIDKITTGRLAIGELAYRDLNFEAVLNIDFNKELTSILETICNESKIYELKEIVSKYNIPVQIIPLNGN